MPYTGSIGAHVRVLEPGHARVTLADRRAVRNHLGSVHAVALANLAEVASGLAMLAGLPDDLRAIVTDLSITYAKKARGTLTAECRCELPRSGVEQALVLKPVVTDAAGDVVATAEVRWLVRPIAPAADRPARAVADHTRAGPA